MVPRLVRSRTLVKDKNAPFCTASVTGFLLEYSGVERGDADACPTRHVGTNARPHR
jgi:hypothetical protein